MRSRALSLPSFLAHPCPLSAAIRSTLLKRIARGSLPGFPPHLRVHYLQQESLVADRTVVDALLAADERLPRLQEEAARWEAMSGREEDGVTAEDQARCPPR